MLIILQTTMLSALYPDDVGRASDDVGRASDDAYITPSGPPLDPLGGGAAEWIRRDAPPQGHLRGGGGVRGGGERTRLGVETLKVSCGAVAREGHRSKK